MGLATKVLVGAVAGMATVALTQVAISFAVPSAMSKFGTVVKGVGTFHSPTGFAATLQRIGAALKTAKAAMGATAVGATVAVAV